MAEITDDEAQRIRLRRWNGIFGNVEGLVMMLSYWLWDPSSGDLTAFQMFFGAVVGLSIIVTWLAGRQLRALRERNSNVDLGSDAPEEKLKFAFIGLSRLC